MGGIRILHLAQSAGYGVTIYVESLIKGLERERFEQILLGSNYYDTDYFRSLVDKLITIRMDRNITKLEQTGIGLAFCQVRRENTLLNILTN